MAEYNSEYLQLLSKKFLLGTITDDEYAILEKWYAERPDTIPVWELKGETRQDLETRLLVGVNSRINVKKSAYPLWAKLAIAASVLLVSAIGITFYLASHKKVEIQRYSLNSTEGHIRKILLPDNSLVWLKGKSSLEYPSKFSDSTRNVVLHGEALFEVSKDKRHPFIIHAGNYVTRVLGTSFNIKENPQSNFFKLTVLTGRVLVTANQKSSKGIALKAPVVITPGKDLELSDAKHTPEITPTQTVIKTAIVNGTEYDMDFNNISFTEVKSRIEKKFNIEIKADDKLYQNCTLSANVTDQSLINTLKVICAAMGSNYNIDNSMVTITGGGCN